ncbi:hypothetical protein ACIQ9E_18240 [Streptomyces sp. NPDC094448]|uniref:hypothetical protein n=1 Tax=Streptomyces sp. NPDC094448 TaxID=3366063 RepID=UPI0037FFFC21
MDVMSNARRAGSPPRTPLRFRFPFQPRSGSPSPSPLRLPLAAATALLPLLPLLSGAGTATAAAAAATGPEPAATAPAVPVADVAHHGYVTLTDAGRLEVTVESRSHGPASLTDATLKLSFSTRLARGQALPGTCVWGSDRVVLCSTGALRVGGTVRRTALDLRTSGTPDEVTVKVATHWNGGAHDREPRNNLHEILAPATGDAYAF